ncbi:MAG: hypothetical protein JNK36_13100 [Bacteroidia bacterium]|nr:hypothetical protein [Bacteroidia bacterium]MBP7713367.1 hypothetical protein [Bacteroidia bacterium]HQX70809.1 hypothetical protein [Bacteroidia bacterium]HRC14522.1 hypothetical protein [Bacteroidia bacterium]
MDLNFISTALQNPSLHQKYSIFLERVQLSYLILYPIRIPTDLEYGRAFYLS